MLSVSLCVAMVIIVLSVMGGFLDKITQAGRQLVGDVAISSQVTGFPHYQELIQKIEQLPEAQSAAATIATLGLIKMPDEEVLGVQIIGINGPTFHLVTGYGNTMVWRPIEPDSEDGLALDPVDLRHPDNTLLGTSSDEQDAILQLVQDNGQMLGSPQGSQNGAVLGIEISRWNNRLRHGTYHIQGYWMPGQEVTISILPIDISGGMINPESRVFRVQNEFAVGRYDVDSKYVFIPFETLQRMLKMHPQEQFTNEPLVDDDGLPVVDDFGEIVYKTEALPARCTKVVVKAADGVDPKLLSKKVNDIIEDMRSIHADIPNVYVLTWEEQIAQFIGAVKKETAILTTLFSIISLVSVFLVLAIFWTIVQQKTRDIGVLRAIGASRIGIAWLFVRYGLIIGILGAVLGGLLAVTIVWNINPIHEYIGQVTNTYLWDPKVYYFNELPKEVNPLHAAIIMSGGILFAVVGALIPGIGAAFVNPVKALRYE